MALLLHITSAEYLGGLSLRLTFSDGVVRDIDFAPFFETHSHPQYNKYREPAKFRKFAIEHGNVVWGKNWDLMFPVDSLHAGSWAITRSPTCAAD